ncbi:hypothetical protein SDC9_209969 [bioreactor metagenome]|uniref:Uncharacterized protein n=1 Tax=bioreactor metagenome TaxID=1076179 RepID=A0A645JG87_9ZZZZ
MIQHQRDLFPVEHLSLPRLVELVDGDGGRDVVAQHHVAIRHDDVARPDMLPAAVRGEYFLCHGHAHTICSPSIVYIPGSQRWQKSWPR